MPSVRCQGGSFACKRCNETCVKTTTYLSYAMKRVVHCLTTMLFPAWIRGVGCCGLLYPKVPSWLAIGFHVLANCPSPSGEETPGHRSPSHFPSQDATRMLIGGDETVWLVPGDPQGNEGRSRCLSVGKGNSTSFRKETAFGFEAG